MALATTLCGLLAISAASATLVRGGAGGAGGPRAVELSLAAAPAPVSGAWFGYNPGDHAAVNGPWTDPAFNAAVAALKPGNLRFPSGTAAKQVHNRARCQRLSPAARRQHPPDPYKAPPPTLLHCSYWDWKNGCEGLGSMAPCKTKGVSTLEKFKITLDAANASAVLVLNMLTDTLDSQLAFLAHAESLGIAVSAVEHVP